MNKPEAAFAVFVIGLVYYLSTLKEPGEGSEPTEPDNNITLSPFLRTNIKGRVEEGRVYVELEYEARFKDGHPVTFTALLVDSPEGVEIGPSHVDFASFGSKNVWKFTTQRVPAQITIMDGVKVPWSSNYTVATLKL